MQPGKIKYVLGPDGNPLSSADLPKLRTRWTPRKKATVILAVQHGLISFEEACNRYDLTHREYREWARAYEQSGLNGLRTTYTAKPSGAGPRKDTSR